MGDMAKSAIVPLWFASFMLVGCLAASWMLDLAKKGKGGLAIFAAMLLFLLTGLISLLAAGAFLFLS